MKTYPGKFDPETGTIPVTFKQGDITYRRSINAVLDADGNYDRAATKLRIAEHVGGVAEKIRLGIIR